MQIVSLDFELRYDFSLTEKCKPFAICEVVNKPQPLPSAGPVNTSPPVISGKNDVGELFTVNDGTWTGIMPITFTYQWKRNGANIIGETNSTYTTVLADSGQTITCLVTANNILGSTNAISNSALIT